MHIQRSIFSAQILQCASICHGSDPHRKDTSARATQDALLH